MRRLLIILVFVLAGCRSDADWLILTTTPDGQPATPAITATTAPTLSSTATPRPMVTNTPTAQATPTQEALERGMPEPPFQIVNENPELIGYSIVQQWISVTAGYVEQAVPDGFTSYNLLQTVDGFSGGVHRTAYAPITTAEETEFTFAIGTIAGEWGYTQATRITAGCYIIKASGETNIGDTHYDDHPYNYSLTVYAHRGNNINTPLERWTLPQNGDYEAFWSIYVGASGTITYTIAVKSSYATAAPESTVTIANISLALDPTGDYCDTSTPRF